MIQLLLHDSWSLLDDFLQFLQVGRLSCNVALSAAYLYHYFFLEPTHKFLGNSMGYFMSCGAKLKDSNHAITLIYVDIRPNYSCKKGTKPEEKRQPKSFTFSSLLLYMEEKWAHFGCEKANLKRCFAKYQNVNKICCQHAVWKLIGGLDKTPSCFLVCKLVMSFALTPRSDQHVTSPYITHIFSSKWVMRILNLSGRSCRLEQTPNSHN